MNKKERTYTIEEIQTAFAKAMADPDYDETPEQENKLTAEMKFGIMLNGILLERALMHFLEEGEE